MMKNSLSVVLAAAFASHGVALGQGLECDYGVSLSTIFSENSNRSNGVGSFDDIFVILYDYPLGYLVQNAGANDQQGAYFPGPIDDFPIKEGDYLYYSTDGVSLRVADVSGIGDDLSSIKVLAASANSGEPIASVPSALYARSADRLVVFDLADPAAPALSATAIEGYSQSVEMHILPDLSTAVTMSEGGQVRVLDLSDPLVPAVLLETQLDPGLITDRGSVAFYGQYVYVATADGDIQIFEVAEDGAFEEAGMHDPAGGVALTGLDIWGNRLWTHTAYGSHAHILDPQTGQPTWINYTPSRLEGEIDGIGIFTEIIDDDFGGPSSIMARIFDTNERFRSPLIWHGDESIEDVVLEGETLLTVSQSNTLVVHSLDSESVPQQVGTIWLGFSQHHRVLAFEDGIALVGHSAFLPSGFSQVSLIDIQDHANLIHLLNRWSVPASDRPRNVILDGSVAYFSGSNALAVYDLSDPATPSLLDRIEYTGSNPSAAGCALGEQNRLYVGVNNAVRIYDVSDPAGLEMIGEFELWHPSFFNVETLAVRGPALYAVAHTGFEPDFQVYDISDPTNPEFVASPNRPQFPTDFSFGADRMLVAGRFWNDFDGGSNPGGYSMYDISEPLQPVRLNYNQAFGTDFHRAVLLDDFALLHGDRPLLLQVDDRCETCGSDIDQDRLISANDIALLIQLYLTGDYLADLNGDGSVNFFDLSQYMSTFGHGCS